MLTLPMNFDLSKIPELRQFLVDHTEHDTDSPSKKDSQLNNSIRKKLFDHNSDDLSSSTTTTTATNIHLATTNSNAPQLKSVFQNNSHKKSSAHKLPKPEIVSSTSEATTVSGSEQPLSSHKKLAKGKTLASSSDSNDDCWKDSFEFDVIYLFFLVFLGQ